MKLSERYNQIIEYSKNDNNEISSFYKTLAKEYEIMILPEVKQLETAKEELINALIEIRSYAEITDDRFENYGDSIFFLCQGMIEKHTGKKLEDL